MNGREEDIALIRRWFQRLTDHVQAVDYAGARPLFAEDLIAFGTFADYMTGRDVIEKQQWRNIWGTIDHFRCRLDDMRSILSADRFTAVGVIIFDSTGYNEDGAPYDLPARAWSCSAGPRSARIGSRSTRISPYAAAFPGAPSATKPTRPELENRRGF